MSLQVNSETLTTELHQIFVNLSEGKESSETPQQLTRVVDLLQQIASIAKTKRDVTFPTTLLDMLQHGDAIKNHVFQELHQASIERQKRQEQIKSLTIT